MSNWNERREPRIGVMLHYDASTSDRGAVEWLTKDPRCNVSYNWLVLDDGRVVSVAPATARAWHAGVCKPSSPKLAYRDANSAFYGIAIAAGAADHATPEQLAAVVKIARTCFEKERWPLTETWRVVGHASEAWPRGRKVDPEGSRRGDPVLSTEAVRRALTHPEGA